MNLRSPRLDRISCEGGSGPDTAFLGGPLFSARRAFLPAIGLQGGALGLGLGVSCKSPVYLAPSCSPSTSYRRCRLSAAPAQVITFQQYAASINGTLGLGLAGGTCMASCRSVRASAMAFVDCPGSDTSGSADQELGAEGSNGSSGTMVFHVPSEVDESAIASDNGRRTSNVASHEKTSSDFGNELDAVRRLEEAVARWESKRAAQVLAAGMRGGAPVKVDSLQQEVAELKMMVRTLVTKAAQNVEAMENKLPVDLQINALSGERKDSLSEISKPSEPHSHPSTSSASSELRTETEPKTEFATDKPLNHSHVANLTHGTEARSTTTPTADITGHFAFREASGSATKEQEQLSAGPSFASPGASPVKEGSQEGEAREGKGEVRGEQAEGEKATWGWFRPSDWKEWATGLGVGGAFLAASMVVVKLSGPIPGKTARGSNTPFAAASTTFSAPHFKTLAEDELPVLYRKAQPGIVELSEADFYSILARAPTFVMFYSPRCHHCNDMYAAWKELPERLDEQGFSIQVAKIDATKCRTLTEDYGIQGVPTLILFDGDEPLASHEGSRDVESLIDFVDRALPL